MTSGIKVEDLSCAFSTTSAPVLRGLSFEVRTGELLALLGPSGSGKTTTLRAIAGFEAFTTGRVIIAGREVLGPTVNLPPEQRHIGFVFQEPALFPHLNVAGNLVFGLRGRSKKAQEERIKEVATAVGIETLLERKTHQLSGGQQQRVALARSLAPSPPVLLLDEPFSHLDRALRERLRAQLLGQLKGGDHSLLWVTHDPSEAMSLADRLLILREGQLVEIGTPDELYKSPQDPFTAGFLGPIHGFQGQGQGQSVETPLGRAPLARYWEGAGFFAFRPSQVLARPINEDTSAGTRGGEPLVANARLEQLRFKGDQLLGLFQLTHHPLRIWGTLNPWEPAPAIESTHRLSLQGLVIPFGLEAESRLITVQEH